MKSIVLTILTLFFFTLSCNSNSANKEKLPQQQLDKYETAYFASGCFWCVEAIFESVKGVKEVVSGYAGGKAETANYQLVSAGRTDHAEAVKVYYDAKVVSYQTLVKVFFGSHDPTTLNRQGPDAGRQYRSAIFYKDVKEKKIVDNYIKKLIADKVFAGTITTEVTKYTAFYDAEAYHQDYEANNPNNPYIRGVSIPRLKRFQKKFPELLKKETH
ncbi:peptide-methionine (S)-S-oxide reductase MsrA [uncultured Kordia sp.]|uniref:peptide-methionine (S)-S-oxide reductase MsrA n=1 Tax=uncultured Kordia sp. TaxID=507699 RepID=UPI0026188852|nr:peptide-methionine (S)-S-oxide reductase MsrA [uncultured Kordia sp.]